MVAASAYRHGVKDNDILHAYRNAIVAHEPDDEGFIMLVGPTTDGSLIEVGFVVSNDAVHVIIHAMAPARLRFLR